MVLVTSILLFSSQTCEKSCQVIAKWRFFRCEKWHFWRIFSHVCDEKRRIEVTKTIVVLDFIIVHKIFRFCGKKMKKVKKNWKKNEKNEKKNEKREIFLQNCLILTSGVCSPCLFTHSIVFIKASFSFVDFFTICGALHVVGHSPW